VPEVLKQTIYFATCLLGTKRLGILRTVLTRMFYPETRHDGTRHALYGQLEVTCRRDIRDAVILALALSTSPGERSGVSTRGVDSNLDMYTSFF
jgi:hypothetical protein